MRIFFAVDFRTTGITRRVFLEPSCALPEENSLSVSWEVLSLGNDMDHLQNAHLCFVSLGLRKMPFQS
jgi:hypothetical protein